MNTINAIYTIGVYGFTEERFIRDLQAAGVDVVVDVRQRRGVRGSRHAFANATRLERALTNAGIAVQSWKDVAPTTALRDRQKQADRETNIAKSARATLSPAFADGYTEDVLGVAHADELIHRLKGYRHPALLCVERAPDACHRSLLASWLARAAGVEVVNLEP